MKKFITLLLVLTGMVCTASADSHIVYLNPGWTEGSDWAKEGARFALYMHNSTTNAEEWTDFEAMSYVQYPDGEYGSSNHCVVYGAVFSTDSNNYDEIKLRRMNGSTTENSTDNIWNETPYLPAPTTDVYYNLEGWGFSLGDANNIQTYSKTDFSFVIAANNEIVNGTSDWAGSSTENVMTSNGDFTYTLTISDQLIVPDSYGYKAVFNPKNWWCGDADNSGDNFPVSITTEGYYDITYTFNFQTGESTATPVRDENVTIKYYLAEVTGTDGEGKSEYENWWQNEMHVYGGVASFYVPSKSLTAGENTLKYKVVRYDTNLSENENERYQWKSYDDNSVDSDYNFGYTPTETGTFNVNFVWNITTSTTSVEAAAVPSKYYYMGGNIDGTGWAVGDEINGDAGVYSVDMSGKANKAFVLVPDYDISNGNVTSWSHVIRPRVNTEIDFANNSGSATLVDESQNWRFPTYNGNVVFTYNATNNEWSVAPYIIKDFTGAPSQDGSYLTTFSNTNYAVAIPDGVTAYYADKANSGSGVVKMVALENGIAANTGAFLKASEEKEYHFTPATTTDNVSANNLFVAGNGTLSYDDNYFRYVFATQGDDLGFYKIGSTFSTDMTGKAYLESSTTLASTGARVAFVFDDDVTGINTVSRENVNNNEYYNLAGQRVAQPAKGLYIVNGKKVVIR